MDAIFSPTEFLNNVAHDLIDNFSRAGRATTPGLVGSAREAEVRRKLEKLLPEKVTVATGCVIDSYGSASRQADVVIHERDNCPVFSINDAPEATYIPGEGTVAAGEIKSTLNTAELKDSVEKIRKIKSLQRAVNDSACFRQYGSALVMRGAPAEVYDPENKVWDQTFSFLLCQSFGISRETLATNYTAFCRDAALHLAPSMILSLADGIVMFADEKGALLRNAIGARHVAFFKHPGGDFQYLLSQIIHACRKGRRTDVLPHSQYILGAHEAFVQPTYLPMA
jgi:hypothetical protein